MDSLGKRLFSSSAKYILAEDSENMWIDEMNITVNPEV